MNAVCPTCGQEIPDATEKLTPRELDILKRWWLLGSVKKAAAEAGITEQRAKNVMASARIRSGVHTNSQLLAAHMNDVRSLIQSEVSQNIGRSEVA